MPDFVGKVVLINSIETVDIDVAHALGNLIPSDSHLIKPQAKYMYGAVGKYGILDLTFQVPDSLLESQFESGISLLKTLHFVRNEEQKQEMADLLGDLLEPTDDSICLTSLSE